MVLSQALKRARMEHQYEHSRSASDSGSSLVKVAAKRWSRPPADEAWASTKPFPCSAQPAQVLMR
jgi:hypothetical protein